MKKRIAVLTLDHSRDIEDTNTMLTYLLGVWRQQGFKIDVYQGIDQDFEADIVISHLDLTVVPDEYSKFLDRFPVVINRRAKDISKRFISRNLLSRDDTYDGSVIVKTDANYGGVPELIYKQNTGKIHGIDTFQRPWRRMEILDTYNYPVFDSIREVPYGVWKNKKLIVEKFLPEIDADGNYRLHYWLFLGDKELGTCHISPNPIVKETDHNTINIEGVPKALRSMRDELGIDYGRMDYAMVNGEPVIYDINTTPATRDIFINLIGDRLLELADGIGYYIS